MNNYNVDTNNACSPYYYYAAECTKQILDIIIPMPPGHATLVT